MPHRAASGIATRFSDYYCRQITWIEESVAALDAVLASSTEPDYGAWVEEDANRVRRLDELVAEYSALKKEWDATPGLSAGERDGVQQLARRVASLRQDFESRRLAVSARLAQAADALQGEAGLLRRGRENARKYGTDEASGGAIVDRRA
jgi:hypothetical protein